MWGRYLDDIIKFSYCVFFCFSIFPLNLGELFLDMNSYEQCWLYIFDVLFDIYGDIFDEYDWIEYLKFLVFPSYVFNFHFELDCYVVYLIYVEELFFKLLFYCSCFLIFYWAFLIGLIYYEFYK